MKISINLSSQCAFSKHQQQQQQPNNLTIDNYYDINPCVLSLVYFLFALLSLRRNRRRHRRRGGYMITTMAYYVF